MKGKKMIKTVGYVFLAFVLCTVLSRGIYSFSIANVTLVKPHSYTIDHSVKTAGKIKTIKEIPVLVKDGFIVTEFYVSEGTKIAVGDPLLRLDTKKIIEKTEDLKKEIKILSLQIEEMNKAESVRVKNEKIEKQYAEDVYKKTVDNCEEEIRQAEERWKNAQKEYEEYLVLENIDETYLRELENKMYEQEQLYESSLENKEKELMEAEKVLNLASIEGASSTTSEQLEVEKQSLKKEKKELEELLKKDGKILAEHEGTVTEININIGDITSETAVILMSDETEGFEITVCFEKEKEKYIDVNSKVSVVGISNGDTISSPKAEIISIKNNETDIEAIIHLKDERFQIGMNVDVEISSDKYTYDNCIPIEAVYQENEDVYYVYTIGKKESILGEEMVARKLPIKIADKDYKYVAIEEGEVCSDIEIIGFSDKFLDEGNPIRIKGYADEE